MDLLPCVFWSLTVHEFWVKHRAFMRAEHRLRSLVHELALMTNPSKEKSDNNRRARDIHSLRRYPVKRWLLDPQS